MAVAAACGDKRWEQRAERWRRPDDRELFDPAGYGVEVIDERSARTLVCEHHYSTSFPAARLSIGLIRAARCVREAVGVAVFSVGMPAAVTKHTAVSAAAGVELGRFICLPSVAFNGETWLFKRAFQALRVELPQVRAVLSYADPVERRTIEGQATRVPERTRSPLLTDAVAKRVAHRSPICDARDRATSPGYPASGASSCWSAKIEV